MKKIILAIALLTSVNTFAFDVLVNCDIIGGHFVECSIFNDLPKQINCTIKAQAMTERGVTLNLSGGGPAAPMSTNYFDISPEDDTIDNIFFVDAKATCDF